MENCAVVVLICFCFFVVVVVVVAVFGGWRIIFMVSLQGELHREFQAMLNIPGIYLNEVQQKLLNITGCECAVQLYAEQHTN